MLILSPLFYMPNFYQFKSQILGSILANILPFFLTFLADILAAVWDEKSRPKIY